MLVAMVGPYRYKCLLLGQDPIGTNARAGPYRYECLSLGQDPIGTNACTPRQRCVIHLKTFSSKTYPCTQREHFRNFRVQLGN